jgi:hypothetical protein
VSSTHLGGELINETIGIDMLADVGSIGRDGSPDEMQKLTVDDFAKWQPIIANVALVPK